MPLLELGPKSTSLSPRFCVRRSRQYNLICWKFDLISGFFVFSRLIVCTDLNNNCGSYLAGGRGCQLKDPHQVPGLKCKLIISSFLILRHLLDCLICTRNTISLVFLLQMMGGCDRYSMGN